MNILNGAAGADGDDENDVRKIKRRTADGWREDSSGFLQSWVTGFQVNHHVAAAVTLIISRLSLPLQSSLSDFH